MTDVSVSSRTASESPLTERQWVRRGELLEAARRVFERDGYHGTTVSAVLQDEMATLLRRRIYWVTRDALDARRRLEAGLRAYFEFYEEYPAWNRRLTIEGLGIDESFEASQTELHQTLATAFDPTLRELG